jgi:hypothetical protein
MSTQVIGLCPKLILEGTRLTGKTDSALALNESPRIEGAFWPQMGIEAGSPRRAQPECRGRRSNPSVSSWAKGRVRKGKVRSWRPIRRLFLSLRVRGQRVMEVFPDLTALAPESMVGAPQAFPPRAEDGLGRVDGGAL